MRHLFHGSFFEAEELKPGIQHTGNETRWDGTESNAWLYAADDRDEAIRQGINSAIEKTFDVDRCHTSPAAFDIYYSPKAKRKPTVDAIEKMHVYLYTIDYHPDDGWELVNNAVNGLKDKEYKTLRTVKKNIVNRERILVGDYLKQTPLRLHEENPQLSEEHFRYFKW